MFAGAIRKHCDKEVIDAFYNAGSLEEQQDINRHILEVKMQNLLGRKIYLKHTKSKC